MTSEDTATESAETPESPVAETSTKSAPKKTAARKPAARKAASKTTRNSTARKTATKKSAAKKSTGKSYLPDLSGFTLEKSRARLKASADMAQGKIKESADMAQTMVKTVVYAQMGVYGVIYDGVASRIESSRSGIPKQWQTLVKRGEKMQKDFDKSQEELKSKIKDIDLKEEAKKFSSSTKESLSKVTSFGKKAA